MDWNRPYLLYSSQVCSLPNCKKVLAFSCWRCWCQALFRWRQSPCLGSDNAPHPPCRQFQGLTAGSKKNSFHLVRHCFSFQGEESNSSANKCLLKVALFSAQLENYDRAIQIYEQVNPLFLKEKICVTRLGEILPFGLLFVAGGNFFFKKGKEVTSSTFYPKK